MKKLLLLSLLLFSTDCLAISPDEIIRRTDDIRNPGDSFSMEVSVKNPVENDPPGKFDVFVKGKDKTLIKTVMPRRDKGRNMLMLDEKMWLYIPALRRAVRISLANKLSGQAANGDIARMRWYGDYRVVIEKQDQEEWILFLQALKKGLTYDKLRVWVDKKTFNPIKAEYLSVGGMVLKYAEFKAYRNIEGMERPTRIFITDAINKNKRTVISILKMKRCEFPAAMFKKNNLRW